MCATLAHARLSEMQAVALQAVQPSGQPAFLAPPPFRFLRILPQCHQPQNEGQVATKNISVHQKRPLCSELCKVTLPATNQTDAGWARQHAARMQPTGLQLGHKGSPLRYFLLEAMEELRNGSQKTTGDTVSCAQIKDQGSHPRGSPPSASSMLCPQTRSELC